MHTTANTHGDSDASPGVGVCQVRVSDDRMPIQRHRSSALRRSAPLMLAAAVGLVLASCGGGSTVADADADADSVTAATVESEDSADVAAEPAASSGAAADEGGDHVELLVDTWNPTTAELWNGFTPSSGTATVSYIPTDSAEFDEVLADRLDSGTAGDIIACRPFDRSRILYENGHLIDVSDLDTPRIPDFAFEAWSSDDGTRYCVPVSSVALGFFYSVEAFEELGLEPPTSVDEMDAMMAQIYETGEYIPLAMGSENQSRIGNFLFDNMGPAFWGGEEGRLKIASGETRVADSGIPELFELMQRWSMYMPPAHEEVDPDEAYELVQIGDGVIVPAGSWTGPAYEGGTAEVGSFPMPGRHEGDRCVVVAPLDFAFGVNANSEHPEEAREFLEFVASEPFGAGFNETVGGQFSLQRPISPKPSALDQSMSGWLSECEPNLRFHDTGFGDASKTVQEAVWAISTEVVQGTKTPAEATDALQQVIDEVNA